MNSNDLTPGLLFSLLPLLLFPAVAVMAARLSRPELFFSITVRPELRGSAAGREILGRFTRAAVWCGLAGAVLALTGALAPVPPAWRIGLVLLGFGIEFIGGVRAYLAARQAVRTHQVAPDSEREAVLTPRRVPLPGGAAAFAGPFVILALAAVWLGSKWSVIPGRFPIHWDIRGQPNGWAGKSIVSVFFGPIIGALTCLFLGAVFIGIVRGARRIYGTGPEAVRESHNRRNWTTVLLVLQYYIASMFGFFGILPILGKPTQTAAIGIVPLVATVGILGAIIFMAFRNGQGGWRLPAAGKSGPAPAGHAPVGDRTPDECWKGGLIYYNPADPALLVEKRFGIGWTVNFGNFRAWFFVAGLVLFMLVTTGLALVMARQ